MISYVDQFKKTVCNVFDPKPSERIAIVFDEPVKSDNDHEAWKDRRQLAREWSSVFDSLCTNNSCTVECYSFPTTDAHNKLLSDNILKELSSFNIIIALTEWSITSSLVWLVKQYPKSIRCASLPGAHRSFHESVYLSDYQLVKQYANHLKELLTKAIYSHVHFSTDDDLYIDLRNRVAGADDGDCRNPGSMINFPSGEGFIAPYEGIGSEQKTFGKSKTSGVIPFYYQHEIVKGMVEQNRFTEFCGSEEVVVSLNDYFSLDSCRKNIAELGIGCNPNVNVTGNMFVDEKAGVHIAYGMSSHIGGKVDSDMHFDLVFAQGCPVQAEQVTLFFANDYSVDIVKESRLCYDLLLG